MKNIEEFFYFLAVRLASVFLIQTWYVPDEYWQSMEVSHKLVFGYGELTWEWVAGIRSYIHPLVIAAVYNILALCNCDSSFALIIIPRILQALLSTYADLCFYNWSGSRKWAAFTISTSWFWFYTGSRTLINSVETALTTIALSQFPWIGKNKTECGGNKFLWIVAFVCVIRPTAAIVWLPLCAYHIMISLESVTSLLFKTYLPIGSIVLLVATVVDSCAHGGFIVTNYEFLKANILQGVGEYYGSLPPHWYLSIGLPTVLGINFLPFIWASVKIIKERYTRQNELALLGCMVFTIAVYSFLPHKEFRFILPLVPIALHISSDCLARWSCKANALFVWMVAGIILIGNLVPIWYLGIVHQRGTLDVMAPLRDIATNNPNTTSVLFLLPCHSTPLYSHLHVNVTTRFLKCEPNLKLVEGYIDEADQFYSSPNAWLRLRYPPNGTLPSHIITFDALVPNIVDILSRYKPVYRLFHTSFPSGRVGRYVLIHERVDF